MNATLWSLLGLLIAAGMWWLKDQPRRLREKRQKLKQKLLDEIEELEDEAKLALTTHDGDRLAVIHDQLRKLRTKARVLARE